MTPRGRYLFAGALLVAAVVYLIVTSTTSTARYYLTVEELGALGPGAADRRLTVSGAVVGPSIAYDANLPRLSFRLAHVPGDARALEALGGVEAACSAAASDPGAAGVDVVYDGVQPAMLRHGAQAIVRGRLGAEGVFVADELMLKCPSRYEEAATSPTALEGP